MHRRDGHHDRRAVDAGQGLEHEARGRHKGAGVSGADAGLRLTRPSRGRWRLASRSPSSCAARPPAPHPSPRSAGHPAPYTVRKMSGVLEILVDAFTLAHEHELQPGNGPQERQPGRDADFGTAVPAHAVERDGNAVRAAVRGGMLALFPVGHGRFGEKACGNRVSTRPGLATRSLGGVPLSRPPDRRYRVPSCRGSSRRG